jgi:hypothetical protein
MRTAKIPIGGANATSDRGRERHERAADGEQHAGRAR